MSKINLDKVVQVGNEYFLKNGYGLYEPLTKEEIVNARGASALTMIKKLNELDGELVQQQPDALGAAAEPLNLDEITDESLAFMSIPEIQSVAEVIGVQYSKSWNKGRLYDETLKALRQHRESKREPQPKAQKITMTMEMVGTSEEFVAMKSLLEGFGGTVTIEEIEPMASKEEIGYIPPANGEPVQTMQTGALRKEENED